MTAPAVLGAKLPCCGRGARLTPAQIAGEPFVRVCEHNGRVRWTGRVVDAPELSKRLHVPVKRVEWSRIQEVPR